MQFSGSSGNTITLQVEPSGAVNFVGTTGSILKIMDNLSGSLFSVNNISGLSILEVLSNNQVKIGNPTNYALIVSGSNIIITGSLVDKGTGVKFLVVDSTTGVVYTTGSGGGGGSSTTPGGSSTQIQYNSGSVFGGVPNLTYSSSFGLRATGSFTGSFTGSLLGTSSWANSSSQAISSSYVNITSTNLGTLTVSYATPGEIQLTAVTSSTLPAGTITQLQYNAGGGFFGGMDSSSYTSGTGQLTLGNLVATGSLFGTTTTASYVNIKAGPRVEAINYNGNEIIITGSIGGSDTHIQFNSGSVFSGSSDLNWNYSNKSLSLTTLGNGKYIIFNPPNTPSAGSPNPYAYIQYGSSNNTYGGLRFVSYRNGGASSSALSFVSTTNALNAALIAGFEFETQASASYATTVTTTSLTSSLYSPVLAVMGRPKQINPTGIPMQVGITTASFQVWANGRTLVGFSYNPSPGTAANPAFDSRQVGDYYKALFSTRGSIALLGTGSEAVGLAFKPESTVNPTYTTASVQGFADNTAMYFGPPGAIGSWRIILSGSGENSTLNIERWDSTANAYGKDAIFTSGSTISL
jgi:hypothetical protein